MKTMVRDLIEDLELASLRALDNATPPGIEVLVSPDKTLSAIRIRYLTAEKFREFDKIEMTDANIMKFLSELKESDFIPGARKLEIMSDYTRYREIGSLRPIKEILR